MNIRCCMYYTPCYLLFVFKDISNVFITNDIYIYCSLLINMFSIISDLA